MKKQSILAIALMGMLTFSACETDRDSNPVFQEPTEFLLNTPASVNMVYDLEKSKTLELTCSQPDYGYTAPAIYSVEVSLNEDFSDSIMLETKYTTAKMNVDASEIALAMTNMAVAAGKTEADFPLTATLYVRATATIKGATASHGTITSNQIILPSVKTAFALPPVTLPEHIYMIGDFCGWNWGNALDMVPVFDNNGVFWRLVYMPENSGFKINQEMKWDGGEVGFGGAEVKDNYEAGAKDAGGNIGITKGGWYLIIVRTALEGRNTKYTVEINEPAVWLIGGTVADGGKWDECMEGWKFTVPATADADFVSPAFAADAPEGPRAYVKVEGYDWWKSEFMVFDGKLEYRATQGDLDRVSTKAGQKMYINFTNGTGKIE